MATFLGPKKFVKKESVEVDVFVAVVFKLTPELVDVFVFSEGKKAEVIETVELAIDDKILGTSLTIKKLKNITALGHEMGCAVFCNVISLYGEKYFDSYVFVDNSLQVIQNPDWYDTEKKDNGCFFTVDQLFDFYNTCAISASDSAQKRRSFEEQCFTPEFIAANPDLFIKIKSGTLNYNYKVANEILFDHAFNNYNQILKKGIKKPAFLIGGKVSIVPYQTMANQSQFFELSTIKIFEESEGGSHSM